MNTYNRIIAHRGIFNNEQVIENTQEAFKEAIRRKIPFELDIQLTKDNKLVVFHDETTKRLTNKNINIQKANYDDIKDLNLLNTNSKIPLLREVLKENNDKVFIDIEIKKSKRWKETISILMNELNPYLHYIVKSFDPKVVKYIKDNYSWVYTGLLINHKDTNYINNILNKSKMVLNYCNPDFVAISKKLLTNKKFMNKIKSYPTFIWTIHKEDQIEDNDKYTYICNIE